MGLYDVFRVNKGPTQYSDNKTPFQGDVIEGGLIFSTVVLLFSFLIVVPGIRGKRQKLFVVIRVCFLIFVGASILICQWSQSWEVGIISNVKMQYKAGVKEQITGDVGLYIGLRGINVTLKSEQANTSVIHREKINYNEYFSWMWEQGRFGFGPTAGRFNQEFRRAQARGSPYPILWVAEYFTIDGEGIRWGRHYRLAGWYGHIMLWVAFTMFAVTIFLTFILIRYAIYSLAICGTAIIACCIIFATLRNPVPLKIAFPGVTLEPKYGWAFLLALIAGILCLIVALVFFLLDWLRHEVIVVFFGIDSLQDAEEEVQIVEKDNEPVGPDDVKIDSEDEEQEPAPPAAPPKLEPPRYKSRDNRLTKVFKHKRRSDAPPPRPGRKHVEAHEQHVEVEGEDQEDYENANVLNEVNLPMKPRKHRYQND